MDQQPPFEADLAHPERAEILAQVAEQMISIRTRLGFDVDFSAAQAGLDPQRLAEAEAAEAALSEDELQRLADAYDVGITAFFGGRVTPVQYLFGL
jgi:transcriptional regulator with XRE-family HTH domain